MVLVAAQSLGLSQSLWLCPSVGVDDLFKRFCTRELTKRDDVSYIVAQIRSVLAVPFPPAGTSDQQDAAEALLPLLGLFSGCDSSEVAFRTADLFA